MIYRVLGHTQTVVFWNWSTINSITGISQRLRVTDILIKICWVLRWTMFFLQTKSLSCHCKGWTNICVVVSNIFYIHPYLGKWSNLTDNFQMGWFNHQLDMYVGWSLSFAHFVILRDVIYVKWCVCVCDWYHHLVLFFSCSSFFGGWCFCVLNPLKIRFSPNPQHGFEGPKFWDMLMEYHKLFYRPNVPKPLANVSFW